MTAPLVYHRYIVTGVDDVPTDVVLRSDGFFAAATPFRARGGGYCARWSAFGDQDFRAFFVGLNAEQVHSYVASGEEIFDEDATRASLKEALLRLAAGGYELHIDLEILADAAIESPEDVWRWATYWAPRLDADVVAQCIHMRPEPQSWAFCTRVLPVLQQMIRDELAAEGT